MPPRAKEQQGIHRHGEWLEVANRGGDLDAYVVHMDEAALAVRVMSGMR